MHHQVRLYLLKKKKDKKIVSCMHYMPHPQFPHGPDKEGCGIPWSWSSKSLPSATWSVGTGPQLSSRAATAFHYWAISPALVSSSSNSHTDFPLEPYYNVPTQSFRVAMVVHLCSPGTWRMRLEDSKFETILYYIARLSQKTTNRPLQSVLWW